jgi:thiamine biosynthesis lipoprotein
MGTVVVFTAFAQGALDAAAVRGAIARALDEMRRLDKVLSSWQKDSELSRLNARAGHRVHVGQDMFRVIDKSLWASRVSSGAFDISFATMGDVWKFRGAGIAPSEMPDSAEIERRRKLVDYRLIELNSASHEVRIPPGRRIGLGGIAKGYAVDRAADVLRRAGVRDFMVQAGGDMYVAGVKPDGQPWSAGIQDPRAPALSFFATIELPEGGFSTAGDYERYFFADGKRYHHIIDPRTGYPATACRAVSVWADSAFASDTLDDIVFILGPEQGVPIVESSPGAGAVVVDRDNRVWISRRLQGKVNVLRAPTL